MLWLSSIISLLESYSRDIKHVSSMLEGFKLMLLIGLDSKLYPTFL